MATTKVIWRLNGEVLPTLSLELADRLIDKGVYDELTCPNYLFNQKGMEPGGANVILQYEKLGTVNGPQDPNLDLDSDSDIATNTVNVDVYIDGEKNDALSFEYKGLSVTNFYELEKYKDILLDKDLVVVELRDIRHVWCKLSDYLQLSLASSDLVPSDTGIVKYLLGKLPEFSSEDLDANINPFVPETDINHALPVSASIKRLLDEALNRTESNFIIGDDGKPYSDSYGEYNPNLFLSHFLGRKSCLKASRTLAESERKLTIDEPYKYSFYFFGNDVPDEFYYVEQDATLSGTDDENKYTLSRINLFPLTYPTTNAEVVDSIATSYREEIEKYLKKDDYIHVYAGVHGDMCSVSFRNSWTKIKIACNPYGVYTHIYGFRRDNVARFSYEENEISNQASKTIWVHGDTTEAVTENTEEFTINVTDQSFNDDLIGTQQIVVNPLNNNSEDTHGYVLKVGDYVTAVSMRTDSDGVTKFLCVDGPCNSDEYDTGNPPTAITLSNDDVDENSPGAAIGSLTVTDEDLPNDTHTLEIIGADQGLEIVNAILKVKGDAGLDSADSPLTVDILATDDGGRKYQETFLITINSVAATGRFALDSVSIAVSVPPGTQSTGTQTAAFYNNDENSIPNNFTWRVTSSQLMSSGDTVTYTVKNYGDDDLTISAATVSAYLTSIELFTSVSPTSATIAAGASQAFTVTCLNDGAQRAQSPYGGTITFTHDGDEFGVLSPYVYNMIHWAFADYDGVVIGGSSSFSTNQNGSGGTDTSGIDGTALEGFVKVYTESGGEGAGYTSLSGLDDGATYDVYVRYRVSASGTQGYKFTNSTTYAAGSWVTFSDMPTTFAGLGDTYEGDAFEKVLTGYVHDAATDPYMWLTSGTNTSQSVYLDRVVFKRTS